MINLLANARTHTPPGTQVHTEVSVIGPEAVVTVTDNGPGIPPEVSGRIFERFARGDASRMRAPDAATGGSTGLGLAIVAAVVDAHHGTVTRHQPARSHSVHGAAAARTASAGTVSRTRPGDASPALS